jgi:hypothetical protein
MHGSSCGEPVYQYNSKDFEITGRSPIKTFLATSEGSGTKRRHDQVAPRLLYPVSTEGLQRVHQEFSAPQEGTDLAWWS